MFGSPCQVMGSSNDGRTSSMGQVPGHLYKLQFDGTDKLPFWQYRSKLKAGLLLAGLGHALDEPRPTLQSYAAPRPGAVASVLASNDNSGVDSSLPVSEGTRTRSQVTQDAAAAAQAVEAAAVAQAASELSATALAAAQAELMASSLLNAQMAWDHRDNVLASIFVSQLQGAAMGYTV